MSIPIAAIDRGQRPALTAGGASQYPWHNCAANREVITNTAALQAAGIRVSPTSEPSQPADLSAAGARYIIKGDATMLRSIRMVIGRNDGGDPNNRMIQWRLRGYAQHFVDGRAQGRVWNGSILADGYAVAGDASVHVPSPALPINAANESANPANYDANWADTIGVNNDYTLGSSCRVIHHAGDAAAELVFDAGGHPLIELEMTCLTDGVHGTAAQFCSAIYRELSG